jgi:hypothetical protein
MIKIIKKIIWKILIKLRIGGPIQLMLTGGLLDDGWFNSFNTKQAIDKNSNPIPWCTYSFIKFIEPRLKKHFDVFEFGSGNSTIWYAARVGEIFSIENNSEWYGMISKKVPSNVNIIFQPLEYNGEYCRKALMSNKKFTIIIIDGRDRVNCVKNSIQALKEDGVIIFDNSNLHQYSEGISYLISNGFKKIDFIGLSPVTPHNNCTSVFYRTINCLGI